ncbi:MAG: glycosyl hydrolase [Mangrovibacterium sp.]
MPEFRLPARAAGKIIVGAEAFTGLPGNSQYTEDPAFLKYSSNGAYASGVNRLFLHHWVHQPFDDQYQPGMGMGLWGTHFGRHQTWFEPGKAFFTYLARCQALLQYGEQVSDYLCMDQLIGLSDVISKNDFLENNIEVVNNQIVLPSGRTYLFMVFSDSIMLPEIAGKIREMVAAGATIVSPKPIQSPSLQNYPTCDEMLKKLRNEVWGKGQSNSFGKGFIYTRLEDAIQKLKLTDDYKVEKSDEADAIKIVHRRGNNTDIYYVANMSQKPQSVSASFRISGKQPELWQAEDASVSKAAVWREKKGRTFVDFQLRGLQTLFVVFRKPADETDHLVAMNVPGKSINWNVITDKNGHTSLRSSDTLVATAVYASGKRKDVKLIPSAAKTLTGAWNVSFVPKLGNPFRLVFPHLIDFSRHDSKEVNYFAGTATYAQTITINAKEIAKGKRIVLDLGEMNDIARVKVNGKDKGVLWYPPYQLDITDELKGGKNQVEIAVTNNWANRLIGDEKEPSDFEWDTDQGTNTNRAMKGFPEWFIKRQHRPSQGRKTFSVWYYYYRGDSNLQPAGLVGPVRLISIAEVNL